MKTIQCLFISVMVINVNQYVLLFIKAESDLADIGSCLMRGWFCFADGSMMNLKDFFNLFPVNLLMHIYW
jgi:hypothetical protein